MHSHKLGIEAKGLEVSQTRIGQEVHPRIVYLHLLFLFTIVNYWHGQNLWRDVELALVII